MGTLIEGLDDHEGYVLWRMADGTLTHAWTSDNRRQLSGYVADCECGWRSHRAHPPTDQGEEAARQEWVREHAIVELGRQADQRRTELAQVLGALGRIADVVEDPANLPRIRRAADGSVSWSRNCSATWTDKRPSGGPRVHADRPDPSGNGAVRPPRQPAGPSEPGRSLAA